MKISKSPNTALYPVPAVLVTSVMTGQQPDIITIAWTGTINSNPPLVYVSVNPSRHSHRLIKESGQYVINIPSAEQAKALNYCGTVSGRDTDKFQGTGLTPIPATHVQAPLIKECPVNLECQVKQIVSLGSHDAFIGEILAVHVNENILDAHGRIDYSLAKPLVFCGGHFLVCTKEPGM